MDKDIKTIAIQKREYAMELIKLGFEILNVLPSKQHEGGLAYIFEKTENIGNEFQRIVRENKFKQQLHGLTLYDIRTLIGLLEGYDISDDDRYRILDVLSEIDNDICGNQEQAENNNIPDEIPADIPEEPVEVNVNELKQAMSGNKDYSKYDKAYNKAVNKNNKGGK